MSDQTHLASVGSLFHVLNNQDQFDCILSIRAKLVSLILCERSLLKFAILFEIVN